MLAHYVPALLDALHTVARHVAEHPDEFLAEVIRRTVTNLASYAAATALVAGASRLRRVPRSRRGE